MHQEPPYPLLAHAPDVDDPTPPPYDIVGDIHGCIDELRELLDLLGYLPAPDGPGVVHPSGRALVFIGDLNDRGPGSVAVWQLALASIAAGAARFVPGNHDSKFTRYLQGRPVQLSHGLAETVREFYDLPEPEREQFRQAVIELMVASPPYRVFDGGRLVVAHAGLEEWMVGQVDTRISAFARWGDPTGDYNEYGHPVRRDWAADYRGSALVVYGHTPTPAAVLRHNTINIDQGCAFGGVLTALRYPELELCGVPARRVYATPSMAERFGPLGQRAAD
jgi:protein phosphatase